MNRLLTLRSEFETEENELKKLVGGEELKREAIDESHTDMARLRKADSHSKGS